MGSPAQIYRQLGTRLAELRAIRKLTQADIAEKIARSTEYVGKIERGEKRVQVEDLGKLAEALSVSLVDIFRGIRLHPLRGLIASESRRAKYESGRTPPADERVAALVQVVRSLEDDDVALLITVGRQLMAARLAR